MTSALTEREIWIIKHTRDNTMKITFCGYKARAKKGIKLRTLLHGAFGEKHDSINILSLIPTLQNSENMCFHCLSHSVCYSRSLTPI